MSILPLVSALTITAAPEAPPAFPGLSVPSPVSAFTTLASPLVTPAVANLAALPLVSVLSIITSHQEPPAPPAVPGIASLPPVSALSITTSHPAPPALPGLALPLSVSTLSVTATPDDPLPLPCPAEQLTPQQRLDIARAILAGTPISELARQYHVSRKFICSQRRIALDALDNAFLAQLPEDQKVLFYLPVTRAWLEQLSLSLVLTCHSSLRGVHEILRDLFDVHKSVGAIHALVQRAIAKASTLNARQDLNRVRYAALDELFQGTKPILSVVDVLSTYCCLLSSEEHRDADTWGIRLLELQEQGFSPRAAIGDLGTALRAGLKLVQPDLFCRGDNFHVVRDAGAVVRFLDNRAYTAISTYDKLCGQVRHKPNDSHLRAKRDAAQREMLRAIALADDVAVLVGWLRQDVLAVAGPCWQQRQALYDFVLAQLQARETLCEHRLKPLIGVLRRHKAELLDFVKELDEEIAVVANYARVPEAVVRELMALQEMPATSARRWQRDTVVHRQLGERYHEVSELAELLRRDVVRASSVVENVNSRLRNYLFLRKEVGQGSLELLRFYLNHHRFLRSERSEREGKSPAELLSGQEHGHWLEMLGYQLFHQSA